MPKLWSRERVQKTLVYVTFDILIINLSILVGLSLWFDGSIPGSNFYRVGIAGGISHETWVWYQYMAIAASVVCVLINSLFKMYNNLWKYASIDEVFKIFIATAMIFVSLYGVHEYFLKDDNLIVLPRRLLFVAWAMHTMLFTFSRFGYRAVKRFFIFVSHVMTSKSGCTRVMVIGAGFSGYGVIRGMRNSRVRDRLPVIVVDDNENKNNTNLLGIRVLSGIDKIHELAEKYEIDEIIIAKTDASKEDLKYILDQCTKTDCRLKILPPISDVSDNLDPKTPRPLRDINIADLLFRDEVDLDTKNISAYLKDRVILVTGGGGSIGSELCRQIVKFDPQKLIILDFYENNAYLLLKELKSDYPNLAIELRIASVREKNRLATVFEEFYPHVVFHAAAHKHVSVMELNPSEAVKNNVFGTRNVVECADQFGVDRFVLISTDKAVNPNNVYGATKRIAEMLIQEMSLRSKTKFMAVRFGNVLGSNGSIIHIFQQQIAKGGPVTVTHPDIERFFMTIPEAAKLVLQTTGLGATGKIYVLDMGSPVKMLDLARNLIKLSGYRPDKDIEIIFTGLLPGEKMYEELIMDEEKDKMQLTYHKKIYITKPVESDYELFRQQLDTLWELAETAPDEIDGFLHEMIPHYKREIDAPPEDKGHTVSLVAEQKPAVVKSEVKSAILN